MDNILENQDKISKAFNQIMQSDTENETNLIKYAHLAQHLLILGDNIDDLSQELMNLENTLAFIRASSTPHSILSLENLKNIIRKLRVLYSNDEILDISYRDFYDIIKLGYFYIDKRITIVIKVPIVYPLSYNLYKLSVIPNKNHEVLIPTLPYIAISGNDHMYMETECPKVNSWFLCSPTSNCRIRSQPDCIQHLITEQRIHPTCKPTPVTVKKEALEQLDEQHYTICFPETTKVKITCGQEQYQNLQGSFLVIIPHNCRLTTSEFTIANSNEHIKGQVVKIMEMPQYDESRHLEHPSVTLNSGNLENLHSVNTKITLQTPVHLNQAYEPSLYHTTIPVYVILCAVVALIIAVAALRLRKRLRNSADVTAENISTPHRIYAVPDIRSTNPNEIRVNPRSISATISNRSSQ